MKQKKRKKKHPDRFISKDECDALLKRLESKSVREEDYETLERTMQVFLTFLEELKREDVTMADIESLFTMDPDKSTKK